MSVPFPEIDLYLEAQHYWQDFHTSFIIYLRDAINELLPDQYLTRIEERIHLVEQTSSDSQLMRPDLLVERPFSHVRPDEAAAAVALEVEPTTIPLVILDEVRERYLKILHRPDRSLVTVVELLSRDNKIEPGHGQYLAKRNHLMRRPVHLVELDFLIGGHRLPMARPLPPGDAYAIVARWDRHPDGEVYAWSIRQPLPRIRLPLQAPDADLVLDLAAVYATAYARGRYARSVDYQAPLTLPLAPEDRAWAENLARG